MLDVQTIVLFIVGVISPFLIQFLKGENITGDAALLITILVSGVLAVIETLLTGGIPSNSVEVIKDAALVMSESTIIYKALLAREQAASSGK